MNYAKKIKSDKNYISNKQKWKILDVIIDLLLVDGLVNTTELKAIIEDVLKKYD